MTVGITYGTYERPLSLNSSNAGAHNFNLRMHSNIKRICVVTLGS